MVFYRHKYGQQTRYYSQRIASGTYVGDLVSILLVGGASARHISSVKFVFNYEYDNNYYVGGRNLSTTQTLTISKAL